MGRPPATAALAAAAALLLSACGADGRDDSPTATAPSPTPAPSVLDELVDVGGGRQLHVRCSGSGSPTVLLESGDASDASEWRRVESELAPQTQTCAYDRLGNGESSPASGCRGLSHLRRDLEDLLRAMQIPGPYLLVGASGGGYLAAGFAYAHPEDVAGIVLVETAPAIDPAQAPPELLAELRCDAAGNQERRDYVAVENEAWSGRRLLGDLPMTVISNDFGESAEEEGERRNVEAQRGWLVLSPRARQVVVTSGHDVPENEPGLVAREILRVLGEARGRTAAPTATPG
jgi:hypothetical protein